MEELKRQFGVHGIPAEVVSDNGPQFSSGEFQELDKDYSFKHTTTLPKSQAERAVQTVKKLWCKNDDNRITFDNRSNTCVKRNVHCYPESGLNGLGLWAGLNEWFYGLGPSPSTNDLVSSFTADVNAVVDHFFPANTVRFHPTYKPWISAHV